MKKRSNIYNMMGLEREIYRLKLDAKEIEHKLDRRLDHLHENYWHMTMNSLFCKMQENGNEGSGFWKSFLKNNALATLMNSIAGTIASKAVTELNQWMSKFLRKKEG